jgi:hypothetical protein
MIPDRFTVTSMQQLCSIPKGEPARTPDSCFGQRDSVVIDHRTGALTVCQQPPSFSEVQDFHRHFNITA